MNSGTLLPRREAHAAVHILTAHAGEDVSRGAGKTDRALRLSRQFSHGLHLCTICTPAYNAQVNEPLTLRERNRRDAWLAMHDAAADLALKHGVALTTVEMIAERAGVSPHVLQLLRQQRRDPGDRNQPYLKKLCRVPQHRSPHCLTHGATHSSSHAFHHPEPAILQRRSELVEALRGVAPRMRRLACQRKRLLNRSCGRSWLPKWTEMRKFRRCCCCGHYPEVRLPA